MTIESSSSQVDDAAEMPSRPATAAVAVYLIMGALVLQVTTSIVSFIMWRTPSWGPAGAPLTSLTPILLILVGVALNSVFACGIWRGSSRFRSLYVALVALYLISELLTLDVWLQLFDDQPTWTLLSLANMAIRVVTAVLLILPSSTAWFRHIRTEEQLQKLDRELAAQPPVQKQLPQFPDRLSPYRLAEENPGTTVAVSFFLGLLMSWVAAAIGTATWAREPLFDTAVLCLPLYAAVIGLSGVIGTLIERRSGYAWAGAIYGIWFGTVLAVLLGVFIGHAFGNY